MPYLLMFLVVLLVGCGRVLEISPSDQDAGEIPHGSARGEAPSPGVSWAVQTVEPPDAAAAGPRFAGFLDRFDRPDGDLRNDWTTKSPSLALFDQRSTAKVPGFPPDDAAIRSGDWPTDIIVSALIRVTTAGEIDLLARVGSSSRSAGALTAYALRLRPNQLAIINWSFSGPSSGTENALISTMTLAISQSQRYRAALRVSGRMIEASVHTEAGASLASLAIVDLSASPHDGNGDVGFALREVGDSVDDFSVEEAR